jgi:hypothetical protein
MFAKQIFILLFVLLSLSSVSATITAVETALDGKNFISNARGFDTLAAAGDSVTLKSAWTPVDGSWEYFIFWDALTGTGSDSVAVAIEVQSLSPSGVVLKSTRVDTITAATAGSLVLPIGDSIFGFAYTVKAKAIAGIGTQLILNRMYLGRRR